MRVRVHPGVGEPCPYCEKPTTLVITWEGYVVDEHYECRECGKKFYTPEQAKLYFKMRRRGGE